MSVVAGVWYPDGKPGAQQDCMRISRALALYGPHREGGWDGGEIALAHRLMRFLPEDRFDRQPLAGRGGRVHLVADCRIDNREELGRALEIDPARQVLMCDAAFIMEALERWGQGALERLCGDFAFAAWDADTRTLLLARDHAGARPLHYHAGQGWFAFASMPKGLLALPNVPVGPDPVRLATWQMLWPLVGSASFFRGVSRLEPGHLAIVAADGRIRQRRFWDPLAVPRRRRIRDHEDAEGLRELLDIAVKAQLRGTGGAALMLSSGLDSTAVASSAAPLLAAEGKRLTAFTNVPSPGEHPSFSGKFRLDEGPLAALMAARHDNIDHRLVRAYDADLLAVIERMILLADQPVMNPLSTAWAHEIYSRAGSGGTPVVLTGTLGNMGLTYTGEHLLIEHAAHLRWAALWRDAGVLVAEGLGSNRLQEVLGGLRPLIPVALTPPRLLSAWRRLKGNDRHLADTLPIRFDVLESLGLSADAWNGGGMFNVPQSWPEWQADLLSTRDPGPLNAAANAGYGVDRRDPTGDRRILEYCLALPPDRFLRNGRCKDVFRRAFAGRIPEEILCGRETGLQTADWKQILLKAQSAIQVELAHQAEVAACSALIDLDVLRQNANSLRTAATNNRASFNRHFLQLTRGLSAGMFIRRATGAN